MHIISYKRLREFSEHHTDCEAEYNQEKWKNDPYF